VKLFSKNSNPCDHNTPTLQTDKQTDGQTTYHGNTALRRLRYTLRAVKKNSKVRNTNRRTSTVHRQTWTGVERKTRQQSFRVFALLLRLIHAFINSRLDYCNSLLYGISSRPTLLRRLQSIQNAAARLVTGAKKFDHMTPVQRWKWVMGQMGHHFWMGHVGHGSLLLTN